MKKRSNEHPHFVNRYVEAIGVDATLELLLKVGGGTVYIARDPGADSPVVAAIGLDAARQLGKILGHGHEKFPAAKEWIARQLFAKGYPRTKIARRLHITDETLRLYLKGFEAGSKEEQQSLQMDLFR